MPEPLPTQNQQTPKHEHQIISYSSGQPGQKSSEVIIISPSWRILSELWVSSSTHLPAHPPSCGLEPPNRILSAAPNLNSQTGVASARPDTHRRAHTRSYLRKVFNLLISRSEIIFEAVCRRRDSNKNKHLNYRMFLRLEGSTKPEELCFLFKSPS